MTGLGIELGAKIKELRNGRNISQSEFAELLGVTKSAVSSYENGTRLPSYEVLVKISRIFKVSTDYLLGCSTGASLDVSGLTARQISTLQEIVDAYLEYNRHTPQ